MISIGNGNKFQNVFLGFSKNCNITQTYNSKHNQVLREVLIKKNLGKKFRFVGTKYFEHMIVINEKGLITYITSSYTVAPKKLVLKAKDYEVEVIEQCI